MYGEEEVNWGQKCPPKSNITHMCQNEKNKKISLQTNGWKQKEISTS